MTASTARRTAAIPRQARSRRRSDWPATLTLARREAVLLVRHPLHLAGVAFVCISPFLQIHSASDSRTAYFNLGLDVITFDGILTYFAAHLCATRAARSRAHGWLDATVTSRECRTAAMCLAALGPFAVACLVLAVEDPIIGAYAGRSADPGPARLFGSAVCVLGAGLLAVAVSRWLRFVGAALVAMIAVIAASVWADNHDRTIFQPMVDWAAWADTTANGPFVGVMPGSPGWHALYLTGWTALAGCAALLAHRRWRYPALAVAVLAGILTVIAGGAQQP
jgi:hypothetical protein